MSNATVQPGWPNPDDAKRVMRSGYIASGATPKEFNAALIGVLSTMVGPAQWAEAVALALNCFRDREGRPNRVKVCAFKACGQPEGVPHVETCPYARSGR